MNYVSSNTGSMMDFHAHADLSDFGTIRHEMGHAFGLKHNDTNPQSIMCSLIYGRTVNTVQLTDNNAAVSLYSY